MFERPSGGRIVGSATLVSTLFLAVLLPVLLIAGFRASAGVVLWGAVTWALAQTAKWPAYVAASRLFRPRLRPPEWAAVSGVVSAASELCASAMYFAFFFRAASILNVIGFGLGASSAEVLFLALLRYLAYRRRPAAGTPMSSKRPAFMRYIFLVERVAALLLHVGSRCLVYWSISQQKVWVGLWALASFSLVDGFAAYGKLCRWNWFEPRVSSKFYAFVFAVGASDLGLFAAMAQSFNH
jgi:hypothetical protein